MNLSRTIAMPNEIFLDIKEQLERKVLKSPHHQEFLYSYYWLIAYFWRYSIYSEFNVNQASIKRLLGYNPNEKRINYIIKKGGVLDAMFYTETVKDFPISWTQRKKEEPSFSMLHELRKEDRKLLTKHMSSNYTVKKPIKHVGDRYNDGLFWNSSSTHMMSGEHFKSCMENTRLGCSGFYLLGILMFIKDKSRANEFLCSNKTLHIYTGWGEKKIRRLTTELAEIELIAKEQEVKNKGSVNKYRITA